MTQYTKNNFIKVCGFPYFSYRAVIYSIIGVKQAFKKNEYNEVSFRIVKLSKI